VDNNFLIFDWFHKPTFSGRYLNFNSQHPLCQKKGTIIGLVDRAFSLSHPRFHNKNLDFVIRVLLDNGYPLKLIFDVFNQRLKYLINKHDDTNDKTQENASSFFTIPYLPKVTEQYRNIIKNMDIKLSFFSLNKLKKKKIHQSTQR